MSTPELERVKSFLTALYNVTRSTAVARNLDNELIKRLFGDYRKSTDAEQLMTEVRGHVPDEEYLALAFGRIGIPTAPQSATSVARPGVEERLARAGMLLYQEIPPLLASHNPLNLSLADQLLPGAELHYVTPHAVKETDVGGTLPPLLDLLVRNGSLTSARASAQLSGSGELSQRLIDGGLDSEVVFEALAGVHNMSFTLTPGKGTPNLLKREHALRLNLVPLGERGSGLLALTCRPEGRRERAEQSGRAVSWELTTPAVWKATFDRTYAGKNESAVLERPTTLEEALMRFDKFQEKPVIEQAKAAMRSDAEFMAQHAKLSPAQQIETYLRNKQVISGEEFAIAVGMLTGRQYIDPRETPPDPAVQHTLPLATVVQRKVVPFKKEGNKLVVLLIDPRDSRLLDNIRGTIHGDVVPCVASEQVLNDLIQRTYVLADTSARVEAELQTRANAIRSVTPANLILNDDNAIVKAIDAIIENAIQQGASDIHFAQTADRTEVMLRIDGTIRLHNSFPRSSAAPFLARIKIMANLDTSEKRAPQSGRIIIEGKVNLRVETIPVAIDPRELLEDCVMRLLPRTADIRKLDALSFSPHNLERFITALQKPYGMFLVTGPTGSGKSTTLAAALRHIAVREKNTLTAEDPVEYIVPFTRQVQMNSANNLTFARALRSFLRLDPDIIMVGEIRDPETAKTAIDAAMTGHMLLSTLHTNDAPGAIPRLGEMGVESFKVGSSLQGVLAQRLVRAVCANCKKSTTYPQVIMDKLGLKSGGYVKGEGCSTCGGSGYKGRIAIHELMEVTPDITQAIMLGDETQIRQLARENGMLTLREDGLEKARLGFTTVEEILAVTNA